MWVFVDKFLLVHVSQRKHFHEKQKKCGLYRQVHVPLVHVSQRKHFQVKQKMWSLYTGGLCRQVPVVHVTPRNHF